MKKFIKTVLILCLSVFAYVGYAQEEAKAPERPSDVGVSDFDSFKNTSFDIVTASENLKKNVGQIDKEVKTYSGVMNTIAADKLRGNLTALRGLNKETETLKLKIGELDNQGKELLGNAKTVTPKMKSIEATSLTKKSVKGLDFAKGNINNITTLLQTDMKLLTDELKARGEPIE
jgi:hypothetical protein